MPYRSTLTVDMQNIIKDELVRASKEITWNVARLIDPDIVSEVGCGCEHDVGCCKDRGCCGENEYMDLLDLVSNRADILQEYITSNKDSVMEFFASQGIKLEL